MRHPSAARTTDESIETTGERMYSTSFFKSFLTTRIRGWLLRQNYDTINIDKYYTDYIQQILDRDPHEKVTEGDINDIINKLHNEAMLIKATGQSSTEHDFIISLLREFLERAKITNAEAKIKKTQDRINRALKDINKNPDRNLIALDSMESIPNLPGFEYFYYKKYTGQTVTKRVIENGVAIKREYTPVMALWKKEGKLERFAGRLLMHFPIEEGKVDIHWSERIFHEKKPTIGKNADTITTKENWTIRKYELDAEVNQELQGAGFLYESGEACMQQERNYIMTQRDEYEKKRPEREFLESIKQSSTHISPYSQYFINLVIDPYLQDDNFSPENHVLEVPGLSHFLFRFPKNPAYTPGKVRIFAVWNSDGNANQPWHRGYMTIQWPIVDIAKPLIIFDEAESIHVLPDKQANISNEEGKNLLLSFIQKVSPETTGIGTMSSTQATGPNPQAGTLEESIPEIKKTTGNISLNVIKNLANTSLKDAHISLDIDGYDEFIITPLGGVSNPANKAFQQGYIPASIRWRKNGTTEEESHIVRINPAIDPENSVLQIDPMYVKKQNVVENTWEKNLRVMDQETFRINQIRSIETKGKRAENSKQREQEGREVEITAELKRGDTNNNGTSGITADRAIHVNNRQSDPNTAVVNESAPGEEAALVETQQRPSEKQESEPEPEKGTQPERKPSLVSRAGGWLRNTFSKIFGKTK